MLGAVLSVLVLSAIAMLLGAFALWRRGGSTKQAGLMVLLAAVMIVNVLIWTLPDDSGVAPVEHAEDLAD